MQTPGSQLLHFGAAPQLAPNMAPEMGDQPAVNPKQVLVIWLQAVSAPSPCQPGAGSSPPALHPQWSSLQSRAGTSISAGACGWALAPCRRSTKHPWGPAGSEGMLARGGGRGGFGHPDAGRLADPSQRVHCSQAALGWDTPVLAAEMMIAEQGKGLKRRERH